MRLSRGLENPIPAADPDVTSRVRKLRWPAIVALCALASASACGPAVGSNLEVIPGADLPVIETVAPIDGHAPGSSPAGGVEVVLKGKNFVGTLVVRVGKRTQEEIKLVSPTELSFKVPDKLPPGESLSIAVERRNDEDKPIARGVVTDAWAVSGLSSRGVLLIGVAIAAFALLGGQLFTVLAAVTLLGIYVTGQGQADFGFFAAPGAKPGSFGPGPAADLFQDWIGKTADSPLFIAIPLFTFAGTVMAESKTPERLVNLARALLGFLPGGVAIASLAACSVFTAFTGASGVTIIALGGLLYPVLKGERYPDRFTLGLLTTCGSLGLLFRPSLPVIIYGLIAAIDVDRLFEAAFLPGLFLSGLLAIYSMIAAVRYKVPAAGFSFAELRRAFRAAIWELPLGFLVIGGMKLGLITAAEASAVTAFYVLAVQLLVYKEITLRDLPRVVKTSMVLVGTILMILGMALGFMGWLTTEQVPQHVLALMEARVHDRTMFLLMLNVFLLIVGCFMEGYSATLVVVPLVAPIAKNYGVDAYHLGVIFLLNLEIAYSLPPVGFNLFLAALRFGRPVVSLYKAAFDFVLIMLVALVLVTYIPAISLCMFDTPKLAIDGAHELAVKAGEDRKIRASLTLGGKSLAEAQKLAQTAKVILEQEEATAGASHAGLVKAVGSAEEVLAAKASSDADRARAREEIASARARMKPLAPFVKQASEAARTVRELESLARNAEWRSRLDPELSVKGLELGTADLKPGEHEITVTAIDGHGHVTQEKLVVRVGKD